MKKENTKLLMILMVVLMILMVVLQFDFILVLREINDELKSEPIDSDVDLAPEMKICQTNCVDVYLKNLDECKESSSGEDCISKAFELGAECEAAC